MQSDEIGRTLLHTKRWMVGGEGVTNASIEASEAAARACCFTRPVFTLPCASPTRTLTLKVLSPISVAKSVSSFLATHRQPPEGDISCHGPSLSFARAAIGTLVRCVRCVRCVVCGVWSVECGVWSVE